MTCNITRNRRIYDWVISIDGQYSWAQKHVYEDKKNVSYEKTVKFLNNLQKPHKF